MKQGFRTIRMKTNDEIHIRDPFVFSHQEEGKYYLFGTTFADGCGDEDPIFEVYVGDDLQLWEGPYVAFEPPKGFYGVRHFWAPEVFEVDGGFYMLASCKGGPGERRGTVILKAEHPAGPYLPHSDGPVTPEHWECLDGTYYEDKTGQRWMIFCHEWTQEYNGLIKAIRLEDDLKSSYGEAVTILDAQSMKWIRQFGDERIEKNGYLTDGPFMYDAENGDLLLLWSSYSIPEYSPGGVGGYTVAIARSVSGKVEGPWSHDEELLMDRNAGHSSLFRDFAGQLFISTHYPDTPHGRERPLFLAVEEQVDGFIVRDIRKRRYEPLEPKNLTPKGWLRDQLKIQAAGMTGLLGDYWPDVGPKSAWLGGDGEGWERGPYYLDGLVPLAYLLKDKYLIEKAQKWIDWTLNSQRKNGWFGPKKNDDWWSRMIMIKVLIQYQEFTKDERVIPFLLKYFRYQKKQIPSRPFDVWAKARGGENTLSLLWLYDKTKEPFLLDLMEMVREQTLDWKNIYEYFPFKRRVEEFDHAAHVVNVAMSLKYLAQDYLITGDESYKNALYKGIDDLTTYHGQLNGIFSGDEWLAGTHPSQGTELCAVVEYMFTLEQLLSIFGDSKFGDIWEQVAYNALPATIDKKWMSHQYDQQVNQIKCNRAQRNWTQNSDEANCFGLEPHFGCCTANMHQGWPKFARHLWMKEGEKTLVCQSYAPCVVSHTIQGKGVEIHVSGNYPFHEKVWLEIRGQDAAQLGIKLRIPGWCKEMQLTINGEECETSLLEGYLLVRRLWEPGDVVEIRLPMPVQYVPRAQYATGITRGPLLFALPIEEEWRVRRNHDPFIDYEVLPKSEWNYGISTKMKMAVVEQEKCPTQPFDATNSPVSIQVIGKKVSNWVAKDNSADTPPYRVEADGKFEELKLVPYGGAKLRIAEFPTLDERP